MEKVKRRFKETTKGVKGLSKSIFMNILNNSFHIQAVQTNGMFITFAPCFAWSDGERDTSSPPRATESGTIGCSIDIRFLRIG